MAACDRNELPPCQAGVAPPPLGLATTVVANGVRLDAAPYVHPQEMTYPPGDDSYWYVALHAGRIVRFPNDPLNSTFEVVLDVSDQVMSDHKQLGMMSLTFHPDFASNGNMFVYYNQDPQVEPEGLYSRVSRFTSTDGGRSFDPASEEIVLDLYREGTLHNGGHLEFGTDGFLYVAMGDGGDSPDPQDHGQDPHSPWGKLLRLDVDSAVPYAVPPDNPFADGVLGAPEVFALGLRNPWQWTMDPLTGEIWLGDVGSTKWEEINLVVAGGNYGWSVAEGEECVVPGCERGATIAPAYSYANVSQVSVIGGRVYRGSRLPHLEGYFLFADYFGQWLKGIRFDPAAGAFDVLDISPDLRLRPASFAADLDGEIWMVHREEGAFYTLVPIPEEAPGVTLPTTLLSETGCTDPAIGPAAASAVMRGYDVNVELWADGAAKDRFLRLPEGSTIEVDPLTGDLDFPPGTVFMKHFSVGSDRVETRLYMRHTDGSWAGYSYAWDDDQSDARLLQEPLTRTVGTNALPWTFPGRTDCNECHTIEAGFTLGPEVLQLAGDHLDAWERDGLFSPPVPAALHGEEWTLPDLADTTVPVALRARGYLHANCSSCHRPWGEDPDLRFDGPESDVCGVPTKSDVLETTVLLAPGNPDASALFARMNTADPEFRMPPLATTVPDPLGLSVVAEWIASMTHCEE